MTHVARELSEDDAELASRRLAALGEPTRLKLAAWLGGGQAASVHELATAIGVSMPNVSKHLQVMHQAGLVSRRRAGTYVHYRLADELVGRLVEAALELLEVPLAPTTRRFPR